VVIAGFLIEGCAERERQARLAEVQRRASLSPEQREAEDKAKVKAEAEAKRENEKTIPYEVLSKREVADITLQMSILVSDTAPRQDVLNLAESLRRQYAGKYEYLAIEIYDSREAHRRHFDLTYGERELFRHWLVEIGGLSWNDGQDIHWLAEGRDHNEEQAQIDRQAAIEPAKAEEERQEAIEEAKWRTWTDSTGEHKVEAKFGGLASGKVKLIKRNGSTVELLLAALSDQDREWIANRRKDANRQK
jgi:hypothetical protein